MRLELGIISANTRMYKNYKAGVLRITCERFSSSVGESHWI